MRNKLKVARAQRAITQADLAAALAISRQTVISIEQGRYVPSTVLALKLARYFGQSVEELFELEEHD
ncbi:helix-turn-helix transcriptional regulator [Hymenobacter canadensis]|uniref:Helix-turn-helix transcriptional regulator n=1 Tax=Hymenobacter canadensis TaxID=2999067 RepID=A0ABY7LQ24_9BACT|nr:helix-turn-helix transcriptional regulator [Hymenobacter canadensis]WBA40988.1 helix-turn-helix transcriptional regulator [Hymenobacter canadensis]